MWLEDDNELDRVIDEAARRLTEGEPGALAGRVLARLDHRRAAGRLRSRPRLPGAVFAATAAATLTIIVAAILFVRPFHGGRRGVAPSPARLTSAAPPDPAATQRPQPAEKAPQSSPRRTSPTVVRSGPEATDAAFALPPLTPSPLVPSSLAIDPIASVALPAADSIAVVPLDPIQPLAVPSIEDRQHD